MGSSIPRIVSERYPDLTIADGRETIGFIFKNGDDTFLAAGPEAESLGNFPKVHAARIAIEEFAAGARYFDTDVGAWVRRCPDGRALGSDDLQNWSRRRSAGRAGADDWREKREEERWHRRHLKSVTLTPKERKRETRRLEDRKRGQNGRHTTVLPQISPARMEISDA